MSKRVSIIIDDDLDKKIRILETKMNKGQIPYTYSRVVNDILRKYLK